MESIQVELSLELQYVITYALRMYAEELDQRSLLFPDKGAEIRMRAGDFRVLASLFGGTTTLLSATEGQWSKIVHAASVRLKGVRAILSDKLAVLTLDPEDLGELHHLEGRLAQVAARISKTVVRTF